MNTSTYTEYFRNLAKTHCLLQHNPDSETGDAPLGEKHFFRYSTDEVITGIRTKISWPAMGIELYQKKIGAKTLPAITEEYQGAFSIFCAANADNYQQVESAYDLAEQILHDILAQIYQQHYGPIESRCSTPFQFFYFDNLEIMPVGPVFDNQYGWRCEFGFRMNKATSITTAPAEGTFIT